jgi:hypothetical protein
MQHYATNPQVIHETIDGETIIIDLATGTYFSLQGAAPAIWSGLVAGEADEQIVTRLAAAYDAPAEELAAAVATFLEELERNQLVARSDGAGGAPAGAAAEASEPPAERAPFVVPRLETYTDMQDIILLDPVHKVDSQGWPHAAPVEPGSA